MHTKPDLITLPDGRQARIGADGRYHTLGSGRWLTAAEVETACAGPQTAASPRSLIAEAVSQAARNQGFAVKTVDQAVGKLIQVQAEIALDKEDPGKATAAARLLGKLTGLFDQVDTDQNKNTPWFVLGRELAIEVLALVEEEQVRRDGGDGK